MTSINQTIYLSSDEEDDKLGDPIDLFDVFSDAETKRTGYRKSKSSDLTVEDDDDCVVLDCDPFKTTEKETAFDTCETDDDDILVVGQKGEIACRDFPHPRHACAKYPFESTSHDKYCDMCHCYVCDIRAPCPHWCIGSIDHCHANDKEQIWKNQREFIRIGKLPPPPSLLPQQNPWYPPVNQFAIRPCSASTMAATRPNTYTRPGGHRPEQPRAPQVFQNQRGGFYYGSNPNPQVFSSKSFSRTQRPSGGANLVENVVHNVAQGSQYTTGYATPPTALQGSSQRTVAGYASSRTNMCAIKFSRKRRSGNAQTSAVPSGTPSPPAKRHQQQSGRSSSDKVLSEIEDWLMDSSTPTDPLKSGERGRERTARRREEERAGERKRHIRRRRSGKRGREREKRWGERIERGLGKP